jgi:3-hydroxybutyryl-CoA dehydrogenase
MIQRIGVIGAGQMGHGVAQVLACSGYDVLLTDVADEQLRKAIETIRGNFERLVAKGKATAQGAQTAMERIRAVRGLEAFADVDLAIETVVEDEKVKRQILRELCPKLKREAIVTTNSSSISITRLAASTDRPEQFMGMHFMNPAPAMELVELIRGIATSEPTFQAVKEVALRCGTTPATAEDFPAFIVNRVLMPMVNEAIYTLYEGVGNVEAIDTAMKLGAHHPMGPLELADFIGLDTCLSIMQVLYEGLADSKYRPCPLLVKYVEAGWLGRKAGRGFYDYRGETPVPTR